MLKIFLCFAMLVFLLEIAFYGFFSVTSQMFVLNKSKQLSAVAMDNTRQKVQQLFKQLSDGMGEMTFSLAFTKALREDPPARTAARQLEAARQAGEAIGLAFAGFTADGLNVSVLGNNGDYFSTYLHRTQTGELLRTRYEGLVQKNAYVWLTAETVERGLFINSLGSRDGPYLTLLAPLQASVSSRPLGFAMVHFNWGNFQSLLREQRWSGDSTLLIYDVQQMTPLFSLGRREELPDMTFILEGASKAGQTVLTAQDGGDYLVNYARYDSPQVCLVEAVPFSALLTDLESLKISMFWCIGVTMLITVLVVVLLYQKSSRPLKALNEAIQQVDKGNFTVSITQTSEDDIGIVCQNFERMSRHIDHLFQCLQDERNEAVRLELEALQMQMRPHFLLNALNSIRWMAVVSQADNVADMVVALSNLLRMVIQNEQRVITVRQELAIVQDYTLIQKRRFGSAFTLEIQLPPDLMDLEIPKFSLQPIVENAILHGVDQSDMNGKIRITGRRAGEDLQLQVTDNGRGMTDRQLAQLKERIRHATDADTTGIGFINVHQRLRITYGAGYGLEINSAPGAGTTVTLLLPAIDKEDAADV